MKDYWKAEELIEKSWTRFEKAKDEEKSAGQRSAFFQLAKYQAKTLHILQTSIESAKQPLIVASLHNILALHKGLMRMHKASMDIIPLPLLTDASDREQFASDLVMRTLTESTKPLKLESVTTRAVHLDMLGTLKSEDIEDNLESLLASSHVSLESGGYVATPSHYTEIDLDAHSLQAMLSEASYESFKQAGFERVSDIDNRLPQFAVKFAEITGIDGSECPELFGEIAELLLGSSLEETLPWQMQKISDTDWPRPYQRDAFDAFTSNNFNSTIIEAPTGSGKTLVGMMCIEEWLHSMHAGESILILVPTNAYQQQWLGELCYNEIGLKLSPEMVYTGTVSKLGEKFFRPISMNSQPPTLR